MTTRTGICPNVGLCENADSKRQFLIPRDKPFQCPNCQSKLTEVGQTQGAMSGYVKLILAVLVVAGLLGVSVLAYKFLRPSKPVINGGDPAPTPSPTVPAEATSSNCKGMPMHKNVWADIQNRGYLIMGVQASAPPMNDSPDTEKWEEDKGDTAEDERRENELLWKRTGFDYELASMLAYEMGLVHKVNVKAREVPEFKDLFCLLNRKEKDGNFSVDMIMSGIARDPAYDETISWSKSYAEFGYALITKKSSYIESIDDCKGKKIGIVKGDNIVKAYVASQLPQSEIVELSDESDEWLSDALNLETNHVDAVVYDYPFAVVEVKGINEQVKEQQVMGKSLEIRIASLPNSELKYSIGVPKGEDDLLANINDAIDRVTNKDNTRYADLIQKYFRSTDITPIKITTQSNVYIVKRGDSLSKIALTELGDEKRWRELASLNNIGNKYLIVPGQKIALPGQKAVAPKETVPAPRPTPSPKVNKH